jgi:hypothetical protein
MIWATARIDPAYSINKALLLAVICISNIALCQRLQVHR